MLDDFMTAAEAAAHIHTTEGTLRWMRCKGKGPNFHKKGRFVFYERSELDSYLADKERGAPGSTRTRP